MVVITLFYRVISIITPISIHKWVLISTTYWGGARFCFSV